MDNPPPPASGQDDLPIEPAKINLIFDRFKLDGGTERLALNTLAAMASRDFEFRILARQWRGPRQAGIEFIECKPFALGRAWRMRAFVRRAKTLLAAKSGPIQAHLMFPGCHVYRAEGGAHAEWLRQRRRIQSLPRRLYDAATPYHRVKLAMEREMLLHPALRAVICSSQMVQEDISRHYPACRAELLRVAPGVDTARMTPGPASADAAGELRARLGIPAGATLFAFVGTGFERKGLASAIDALARARLDQAHLVVVGRDRARRGFRRLARRHRLAHCVHFVGAQEEVAPYYWAADALVHPALYEPFGMVVAEAMAAGIPVLSSTRTGAALAMIEPWVTGWLGDALDTVGLAEAMRWVANRDNQARATGRAACMQIAGQYDLKNMGDRLSNLYQRLAGEF